MVEHLGEVQPHGGDEFVFRVGSQRVFFKRPQTHDLGLEEVSRLRKLLKEAGPRSGRPWSIWTADVKTGQGRCEVMLGSLLKSLPEQSMRMQARVLGLEAEAGKE